MVSSKASPSGACSAHTGTSHSRFRWTGFCELEARSSLFSPFPQPGGCTGNPLGSFVYFVFFLELFSGWFSVRGAGGGRSESSEKLNQQEKGHQNPAASAVRRRPAPEDHQGPACLCPSCCVNSFPPFPETKRGQPPSSPPGHAPSWGWAVRCKFFCALQVSCFVNELFYLFSSLSPTGIRLSHWQKKGIAEALSL